MYLRGCKFSYEKTKQKLDMWHTVRTHCPDMFDNWSWKDSKMKELIKSGYISCKICLRSVQGHDCIRGFLTLTKIQGLARLAILMPLALMLERLRSP